MSLGVGPIFRALARNKATYAAVVLQIAVGYAIVVQSLLVADGFVDIAERHPGWDEDHAVVITVERYVPSATPAQLREKDLAALAAVPGVRAVSSVVDAPQSRRELPETVQIAGGERHLAWPLIGDAAIVDALGGAVEHGRAPTPADVQPFGSAATAVLLSRRLADQLFGPATAAGHPAIGRELVTPARGGHAKVIGVLGDVLAPVAFAPHPDQVVVYIATPAYGRRSQYVARLEPGLAHGPTRLQAALHAADPDRRVTAETLAHRRATWTANAYAAPKIIDTMNTIVVAVALFGSLGMASFLVSARTRQVGIRRALGARGKDIVVYFLVENMLVTLLGLLFGLPLNLAVNQALLSLGSEMRLGGPEYLVGAALFLVAGTLGALVPALRAQRIPPVVASKGAAT